MKTLQTLEHRLRAKDPDAVVAAIFVRGTRTLLALHPDRLVKLASVTKVFTAAAALQRLGPDYRFKTKVFFRKAGHRLYIQGTWDPSLNDESMQELAKCVQKHVGNAAVRVFVVKNRQRHLPYCGPKDKNDHVYASESASLMLNLSAVKITVGPVQNRQLRVAIRPDAGDYFKVDKRVRITRRGRWARVAVKTLRGAGQTIVRIRGRFPLRAHAQSVLKRVFHPVLFAGWVFTQALRHIGVKIMKSPVVTTHVKGRLLCENTSKPLSQVLVPILQHSLNPGAQAVADAIVPASQVRALHAIIDVLYQAGVRRNDVFLNNGCGLGCGGISTVRSVVKVLKWSTTRPWAEALWHALPKPGKGTLRHRFLDGPADLRAKTGTLDDCTALAGAFNDHQGRRIFFAVVVNARGMDRVAVVHVVNRVVKAIATGLSTGR